MKHSEDRGELFASLSAAQGQMKPAAMSKVNPAFRSRYADLNDVWEAMRGPFHAHGLSVVQVVETDGQEWRITTILAHKSGQFIQSEIQWQPVLPQGRSAAQAVAGDITYYRRYALAALAGVTADEDVDGNQAEPAQAAPRAAAQQGRPPQQQAPRPRQDAAPPRQAAAPPPTPPAPQPPPAVNVAPSAPVEAEEASLQVYAPPTPEEAARAATPPPPIRQTIPDDAPGAPIKRDVTGPPPQASNAAKPTALLFAVLAEYGMLTERTPEGKEARRALAALALGREVPSLSTLTEEDVQTIKTYIEEHPAALLPTPPPAEADVDPFAAMPTDDPEWNYNQGLDAIMALAQQHGFPPPDPRVNGGGRAWKAVLTTVRAKLKENGEDDASVDRWVPLNEPNSQRTQEAYGVIYNVMSEVWGS